MSFKTVLTIIGVHQPDGDLKLATELCGEIDAHLSILVLALAAPPPVGDYAAIISDAWLQERNQDLAALEARVVAVREELSSKTISIGIDSEYSETAFADDIVGERARYADLTLVGPNLFRDGELKNRVINGGLFESGRPLLIIPEIGRASLAPKTVLLAWDSRIEAARATREAMDLMKGADAVHVTLVDPDPGRSGAEPGADVAAYLARHDIRVTVHRLPRMGGEIADVLKQHAANMNADLIVMGAYSHSRLRERIFGGVTKSMIESTPVPVLMAR